MAVIKPYSHLPDGFPPIVDDIDRPRIPNLADLFLHRFFPMTVGLVVLFFSFT